MISLALVLVLVFQTVLCIIVTKLALSFDDVTEDSWTAKAPGIHRVIEGERA